MVDFAEEETDRSGAFGALAFNDRGRRLLFFRDDFGSWDVADNVLLLTVGGRADTGHGKR